MLKTTHSLRLIAAAVWLLALYYGAGIAVADTLLRFKFTEGEKLRYECRQTLNNSVMTDDKSMVSIIKSSMSITQQVKSVDADGTASLAVTINHVKCKIALPTGQTLEYDSTVEEPEDEMVAMIAEQFGQIIDKPIELKIDPLGKISDVKLPEEMLPEETKNTVTGYVVTTKDNAGKVKIDKIEPLYERKNKGIRDDKLPAAMKGEEDDAKMQRSRAGNAGKAETVVKEEKEGKKELDDRVTDKMKELFGGISFPAAAVAVGETWTATAPMPNLPNLVEGVVEQTFEYRGAESDDGFNLEKIAMTAVIKQNIGEDKTTRRYMQFKDQDIHGEIFFDNKTGRVQHSRVKSKLSFIRQMMDQDLTNTIDSEDEFELISNGDEK